MQKQRKQTTFREDVAKLLLDWGKLVFGAVFLGGVLRSGIPYDTLITRGLVATLAFSIIGLILGLKEKKE
jgi:hypothetical protein